MRARELAVGPGSVPGASRHLRGRARLGALLPDRVRARALGRRSGRPGAGTGLVAGGYKAIDSRAPGEGLPRLGRRHHPGRHALRGRARLRGQARQGATSSAARPCSKRRSPKRRLACLVLSDPRSVALGSEPVRVDGELVGRVTSGGYGYTVERSIAYAYVPAGYAAARATGRGRDLRGVGRGRGCPEPLFDPAGERLRG